MRRFSRISIAKPQSARSVVAALAILIVASHSSRAVAEVPEMQFQQLPAEVQTYVDSVRKSCKELDQESQPSDAMQGIAVVDLDGDGSRDLFVDAEELCNTRMAGANCTNRGCDLKIWKQTGTSAWRKIFDEHLYRKFVSMSDNSRLSLMAVSVYAGDPHCGAPAGEFFTSGQSCDALVRYQNGQWLWEKIK
jgi:hypothetical protein